MLLTCRILLPGTDVVRPGAVVRVLIEDVSMADAAARTLASASFPAEGGARELGPFTVAFSTSAAANAAVRVHVDQNGDTRVRIGDLVSVAHHDVPRATPRSTSLEPVLIPVWVVAG